MESLYHLTLKLNLQGQDQGQGQDQDPLQDLHYVNQVSLSLVTTAILYPSLRILMER